MVGDNTQAGTSNALVPADAFDADMIDIGRNALGSGLMSPAEVKRMYNLSDAEIAEAQKPAPKKSNGLDAELRQIAKARKAGDPKYLSKEMQLKERELIELKAASIEANKRPLDDGTELSRPLRDSWSRTGGLEFNLATVQASAQTALDGLDREDAIALEGGFNSLPQSAREAVFSILATPAMPAARPASETQVKTFASTPFGEALIGEWGNKAGQKLGMLQGRMKEMLGAMQPADREKAETWFDAMSDEMAIAVCKAMLR